MSLSEGEAADRAAVRNIKASAKVTRHVIHFTDTEIHALIAKSCHWCGQTRANTHGKKAYVRGNRGWNGLDRLDNKKDYTHENTVPCCGPCNMMKGTMAVDALLAQCLKIVRKHQT